MCGNSHKLYVQCMNIFLHRSGFFICFFSLHFRDHYCLSRVSWDLDHQGVWFSCRLLGYIFQIYFLGLEPAVCILNEHSGDCKAISAYETLMKIGVIETNFHYLKTLSMFQMYTIWSFPVIVRIVVSDEFWDYHFFISKQSVFQTLRNWALMHMENCVWTVIAYRGSNEGE